MCGIVGYTGNRPATEVLIQGLRRLEYRGYDSAGIALLQNKKIEVTKSEGRLANVEKLLDQEKLALAKTATCGIGHTRWATHGRPNSKNAHPHKTGHVALVHNGIIENYLEIRKELLARGHKPISETDSELFGFLVLEEMNQGRSLLEAVRQSFLKIHGQCSVVVMSEKEPDVIVGVRNGSPLVAALDPGGGVIIASDAQPLLQFTSEVTFLEHGDVIVGSRNKILLYSLETGKPVERTRSLLNWSLGQLDKAGFEHYMLKEIHEQPTVLTETLNAMVEWEGNQPKILDSHPGVTILEKAQELVFVACGTSWHAALIGKSWIEKLAKIPVTVALASEFRYSDPILRKGTVVIGVSQSGETADTLAVLRDMKKRGIPTLGISNVRGSSICREADSVFFTLAGPEIGVAATKTFTGQMMVMYLMAAYLASRTKSSPSHSCSQWYTDLAKLPHWVAKGLAPDSQTFIQTQKIVEFSRTAKGFFFIGRGYSFPMALEGALKLKEIAYDYAEGYAAGELKHGPIAMIDDGMVVVVLAPKDSWRDKTVSNLEEVKARGAKIVGVGDVRDFDLQSLCDMWIPLPVESQEINSDLLPFLLGPIVQLLSYHRAVWKGTDVDKPRNLAKSVTVE